ncbi:hypothetical protein K4L44_05965 [Halosquirtibacter laminarini]|uniref:Uncharacterized protein n=1 Tax=Halosquirtibacter laminarini TaxID=3374600 RepID=A0AC61NI44_9BACT|nr:hypothetical protein K4L44_05965 [Prolixibacteraceae bacterium]
MKKDIKLKAFQLIIDSDSIKRDDIIISNEPDVLEKNSRSIKYNYLFNKNEDVLLIDEAIAAKYPYSKDAYDFENHIECETPYDSSVSPFDEHNYYIIDIKNSTLWISDIRRDKIFKDILKQICRSNNICIKNIYNKEQFIQALRSLNTLKMSVTPSSLLFSNNSLNEALSQDVFMYDAADIEIKLKYADLSLKRNQVSGFFSKKDKLEELLNDSSVKSLLICGKDKDNRAIFFNSNAISEELRLRVEIDEYLIVKNKELLTEFEKR